MICYSKIDFIKDTKSIDFAKKTIGINLFPKTFEIKNLKILRKEIELLSKKRYEIDLKRAIINVIDFSLVSILDGFFLPKNGNYIG